MQPIVAPLLFIALFNGHNFDGWEGDLTFFRVQDG